MVEISMQKPGEDESINAKNGPTQVKTLPGQIQTTMDVVYVGPNRLRFLDEPKPPDPTLKLDSQEVGTTENMEEVQSEESGEDQDMVANIYKN
ncbi:hypothetical protein SESBI_41756 [Sesbania bispinosa]|nr:hypothetical protein SESBI_41756 [Sesbania bispinosa]